MPTKVLITGITGMVGTHLVEACNKKKWQLFGISRKPYKGCWTRNSHPVLYYGDILNHDFLSNVFSQVKPDIIFHLAAQPFNNISWQAEALTHNTNYFGTLNILQTCRQLCPEAKLLLAGTSVQYGAIKPDDCPVTENMHLKPTSPYGVSKASAEMLGYQYYNSFGLSVYLPRLFALVGPGHLPNTVIQSFARQLALIARGKSPTVLKVGNLNVHRDFLDARDGARALLKITEKWHPGQPINVCSQIPVKVSSILDMLVKISGLKVTIERDPSLIRKNDTPYFIGDNQKLLSLGWAPKYKLEQTLLSVYKDWLQRV